MAFQYGNVTFNTSAQDQMVSITWDGNYFWLVGWSTQTIYQYTDQGVYTGFSFSTSAQQTNLAGIAFDGTDLWTVGTAPDVAHKYSIDGIYSGVNFAIDGNVQGMVWDGTHFWLVDIVLDTVKRYTAAGVYDNFSFSTASETGAVYDIGFDGTAIWVNSATDVYKYTTLGVYTGITFSLANEGTAARGIVFRSGDIWTVDYTNAASYQYVESTEVTAGYPTEGRLAVWEFEGDLTPTLGQTLTGTAGIQHVPAVEYLNDSTQAVQTPTSNYIVMDDAAGQLSAFSSPEMTISFWVKPTENNTALISNYRRSAGSGSLLNAGTLISVLTSGELKAYHAVQNNETATDSNGNVDTSTFLGAKSAAPVVLGEWVNVTATFSRSLKTTSLYINGVFEVDITTAQTPQESTSLESREFIIGATNTGSGQAPVNDGTADFDRLYVYTRVLTPVEILSIYNELVAAPQLGPIFGTIGTPVGNLNWWEVEAAAPTCVIDPYWTSTVLLSHFDNLISPNSLKNEKGYPMVSYGAYQNNSNPKIGQGALQFQSGDYIEAIPYPESILSDTAYTLETWIYATEYTDIYGTIFSSSNTYAGGDWFLAVTAAGNLQLSDTEAWGTVHHNTVPLNTWVHVAAVYDNDEMTLYLDGVKGTPTAWRGSWYDNGEPIRMGVLNESLIRPFVGYMDEVRITNAARYSETFTPETTESCPGSTDEMPENSGNLLTNGDFSDGTTGWSTTSPSTIVVTTEQMTISRNSAAWGPQCSQDIVTEIGESYTFSGELISESPGTAKTSIMLDGVENSNWAGADITFVATSTTTTIDVRGAGDGAAVIVVDNLSVIKV